MPDQPHRLLRVDASRFGMYFFGLRIVGLWIVGLHFVSLWIAALRIIGLGCLGLYNVGLPLDGFVHGAMTRGKPLFLFSMSRKVIVARIRWQNFDRSVHVLA
jgi:hypothetical protein